MRAIFVPEASLGALMAGPGMFFGLAAPIPEGLGVVKHRSIEKRELDDERVRTDLLRWAACSGMALIECHRHIDGDPACMSWTDVVGLTDWVPHVQWRIGGQPYAALVLAETTVDGALWTGRTPRAVRVDAVVLGAEWITTTGRSVARLESQEERDARF